MKKQVFVLVSLLFSLCAHAEEMRILNVFYDGVYHELTVNTVTPSQRTGFFRTQKIKVISNRFLPCRSNQGCDAVISGEGYQSFSIMVGGVTRIARITVDNEGVVPASAFRLTRNGSLVLNLNVLSETRRVHIK